jgi:hypothetical protein
MAGQLARTITRFVALCHPGLANFPHHVHQEDGTVALSPLTGNPEQDVEHVAAEVNAYLTAHL